MKKLSALIMAMMLLMLAFAGSVSAAENKQPIKVWLGDQEVKFDVPPVLVKGTTYVEFKGLFKALGYSITYDEFSKQITGKSKQGTLTLNTVTGEATVNGEKQEQSVQPIIRQGRTLVPLRFIAEATDMNVEWSKAAQTVTITPSGPSEDEVKEIEAFLKQFDAYSDANDLTGLMKMVYPGSPIEVILQEQLEEIVDENVVTKSTSTLTDVLDWQDDSAVIEISAVSEKVSGGFYIDNKITMQLQLQRGDDNQWKLYMIAPQNEEYLNVEEAVSKEADVPADAKAAIQAVIDKQMQAMNDEDLEAYKTTIDPNLPGLNETIAIYKQLADTYDLKYTAETVRIVEYSDSEAQVYIVQKTEKLSGPAYNNNRVHMIAKFVKTASGQWVSGEGGIVINIEEL